MENSVLSDAAGVQKNIAKMYEDYAKSIGKSTDALTQSEKAQAVYNGIMDEAAMFTGTAEEMASGCSMCGNFCAVKNMNKIMEGEIVSIFDE